MGLKLKEKYMRLGISSLLLILLLCSCSSSIQKKEKSFAELNQLENIPFEKLKTVRVIPSFVSDKVDQKLLRQAIIDKFGTIGIVHTPDDTSLEKVLDAQKKPFALLTLEVKEITTSDYEKTFPIISLSCRMYEETELVLNKQQSMSNVWEKTRYIEILSDQKATTNTVNAEIDKLLQEFSDSYYQVNSKSLKPAFYFGKDVE
jgi:hypothetical protein